MSASPCLAVFDLDGTLAPGDTCARFLLFVLARRPASWLRLPGLAVRLLAFKAGRMSETEFKEAAFGALLRGLHADRLDALARAFAARTAETVRPQGLARLRESRGNGCLLVLATASPDIYVRELARLLDLDGCVCTRTQRGPDGSPTGRLDGENCKREAKLTALRAWLHERPEGLPLEDWEVTAYSDDVSDLPLLLAANHAVAVHPTRALRREAAERGWTVEEWS